MDEVDTLILSDLNMGDVALTRSSSDPEITVKDGSKIVVGYQFGDEGIEKIVFKDGEIDRDSILEVLGGGDSIDTAAYSASTSATCPSDRNLSLQTQRLPRKGTFRLDNALKKAALG